MPYFGIPIRNGLPIGLGSVAGFGVQQFSPADLFSAGEQGAWYDPSDFSTLFTDSAGTTPVTGVEQFVGRMNDKSGRGNHATQTTSAKRPKLAARYNLLTYSEQFDNGAWTKDSCTISGNATTAPDGTLTADKIVSAAATAATGVSQSVTASAVAHTASYYVKAAEATFVQLLWSGARSAEYVNFNLSTGVISAGSYTSASITAAANGFWRITLTSTFSSAGSAPSFLWMIDSGSAGRAASYTGNGANGFFAWGADLRPASQATGLIGPTYQRVVDATTYDAVGFLPYLEFNGLSWSMSHTFGINADATFMAGACRVGGTLEQGLFGATPPSTRLIGLLMANAVNPNWGTYAASAFRSSGKSLLNNTAVITNVCEPSLPSQKLYTNNSLDATITGALYAGDVNERRVIGEENVGASRFFLGNVYGIVAVDKVLTTAQREATVAWLAQKSGVSL